MIKNKQRWEMVSKDLKRIEHTENINYLEEKVFPKIKVHRKPDPDKKTS